MVRAGDEGANTVLGYAAPRRPVRPDALAWLSAFFLVVPLLVIVISSVFSVLYPISPRERIAGLVLGGVGLVVLVLEATSLILRSLVAAILVATFCACLLIPIIGNLISEAMEARAVGILLGVLLYCSCILALHIRWCCRLARGRGC